MLARLIRSPELRWHTPFVLVAATAWLLARPVVTGVLLVGTAVSLTLMLVGRHASQRESSAVAARYPSAVAHFRMDLLPDSRDEQAPPGSRLRPVELVVTPDGLVLLAWRTFEVIHEWSWGASTRSRRLRHGSRFDARGDRGARTRRPGRPHRRAADVRCEGPRVQPHRACPAGTSAMARTRDRLTSADAGCARSQAVLVIRSRQRQSARCAHAQTVPCCRADPSRPRRLSRPSSPCPCP